MKKSKRIYCLVDVDDKPIKYFMEEGSWLDRILRFPLKIRELDKEEFARNSGLPEAIVNNRSKLLNLLLRKSPCSEIKTSENALLLRNCWR